jgi:hypothetical protein
MKQASVITMEITHIEGEGRHALPRHCMYYSILHGYNIGEQQIIIVL